MELLSPFSYSLVQFGTVRIGKPAIKDLPVERMLELVVCRKIALRQFVHSCARNELMPFNKSLTEIFNVFGIHIQCGGYAPDGEALSRDTGAFQDALLGRTQLLELHLDHLL